MSFLSMLFGTHSENSQTVSLRYDGVYLSQHGKTTTGLRFYDDGFVCDCSTPSTPAEIMGLMLCREAVSSMPAISFGNFKINGSAISFVTSCAYGKLEYTGHLQKNSLLLNSYSHINGHRSDREVFNFVHLAPKYLDPRNLDQLRLHMLGRN
jgi:hypothetical protein